MTRFSFLFFLCFPLFFCFGQSPVGLSGKIVQENGGTPLSSATVYLTRERDSTLIDYTLTDKRGDFTLKTRSGTEPVLFQVSFMGFTPYEKRFERLEEDLHLGEIALREAADRLEEVVVRAEAPPVRIKKDTIEFNAASFRIREGANVEELLKQLPGVEVDMDGTITVQGREVNKVLVDGKPFFEEDGSIAVKNLPADIIDKVQVSDTKTREQELTGEDATSDEKTINLTIQEGKNRGYFGRVTAGYGTDERYEAGGMLNYFKDNRRLSLLGSANNINSVGFSMDEVFDAMGGGRSVSYTSAGGGTSFSVDGMQFGSRGAGITTSAMAGLNFSDGLFDEKLDTQASYFYTHSDHRNDNRTRRINLLPDGEVLTESESTARNLSDAHTARANLEWKIDTLTTLRFAPRLTRTETHNRSASAEFSEGADGALLNESEALSDRRSESADFSARTNLVRNMRRKGRNLSFSMNNSHSRDRGDALNRSATLFHSDEHPDDIRDQNQLDRGDDDRIDFSLTYTEPVSDSLRLIVGADYGARNGTDDRTVFDFDNDTQDHNLRNELLSLLTDARVRTVGPNAGLRINRNKYTLRATLGTEVAGVDYRSEYTGDHERLTRNFFYPTINTFLNYRFSTSKRLTTNYRYQTNVPNARQMLPVQDLSNPLRTHTGNPELDASQSHSIGFNYNAYDFQSRSGLFLWAGFTYNENQIVQRTSIDENFVRSTSYTNLSGIYNGYAGGRWNASKNLEAHTLRYGLGLNGNLSRSKGFVNEAQFTARSYVLRPAANIGWEYGEVVQTGLEYSLGYSQTDYTNYTVARTSNTTQTLKLQTTLYWPENVVFGNDLGYTYNGNVAPGFQRSFWLWNTSLGYQFFDEKLTARVKVYDLLNQNVSAIRTIEEEYIQDTEDTVLERYVMFSLTLKIDQFGGERPQPRRRGGVRIRRF